MGRSDEAVAIADDTIAAARAHANPHWIAFAYRAHAAAFTGSDPDRALDTMRVGLAYSREHQLPYWKAVFASGAAGLEADHGDLDRALDLFATCLDSFHQAGDTANVASTFRKLAAFFERTGQPEVAATIYGTTTRHPKTNEVVRFAALVDRLDRTLDAETLEACVQHGASMNLAEAVQYAHHHIETSRQHPRAAPAIE